MRELDTTTTNGKIQKFTDNERLKGVFYSNKSKGGLITFYFMISLSGKMQKQDLFCLVCDIFEMTLWPMLMLGYH